MLTRDVLKLPEDFFLIMLEDYSEDVSSFFLTNKDFYQLYQKFNSFWSSMFFNHFHSSLYKSTLKLTPHRCLSFTLDRNIKTWRQQYRIASFREGIHNFEEIMNYKNAKNKNPSIFDGKDLKIINPNTSKSPFNHLVHYAAYSRDQPLLNYLFLRLLNDFYKVESVDKVFFLGDARVIAFLNYAVVCNQVAVVKTIIEDKKKKFRLYRGETLAKFISSRHRNSIEFIGNALHLACLFGFKDIVKLLIDKLLQTRRDQKPLYSYNKYGQTEFCLAVFAGHLEIFPILAPIIQELLSKEFAAPLSYAVCNGDERMVQQLAKIGFKGDWTFKGTTPLHLSLSKPNLLKILLNQKEINLKIETTMLSYPFVEAIKIGNLESIQLILSRGQVPENLNVLNLIASYGHVHLLEYFIDVLKIADSAKDLKKHPIHFATEKGHEKAVLFFIERGVSVDIKTANGKTPLNLAIINNHFRLSNLLLAKGASPHYENNKGISHLHYLAYITNPKSMVEQKLAIKTLIQKGISIFTKNQFNESPLDLMIEFKNWELLLFVYDLVPHYERWHIQKKLAQAGFCISFQEESEQNKAFPMEIKKKLPKTIYSLSGSFFYPSAAKKQENENCFDWAYPSIGLIALALAVPVIGWAYLIYMLLNFLIQSCCSKKVETPFQKLG